MRVAAGHDVQSADPILGRNEMSLDLAVEHAYRKDAARSVLRPRRV